MKDSAKKIIVLVPGQNAKGGITNYYYSIRKFFPTNIIYLERGVRNWPLKVSRFNEVVTHLKDYMEFVAMVSKRDVAMVQTTTAFASSSILRDGIFIFISKLFRKKTIVFFRGWDDKYVYNISGVHKKMVYKTFLKADAIIDLSVHNIEYLKQLGYKNKLYLETTLVDESLIENIDIDVCINNRFNSPKKNILFLSRIEKTKGIYEVLEVFKKIKKTHADFNLIYAGDGLEMDLLKQEVAKQNIIDIEFAGFVKGEKKKNHFINASIFVFLSEFEGMPNAVLEAMAFGLPVITTNVGGISTVFNDKKNGRLLDNTNINFIAENIIDIVYDEEKYKKYSKTNYLEAKNKFWSSVVAKRMMNIFNTVLEEI